MARSSRGGRPCARAHDGRLGGVARLEDATRERRELGLREKSTLSSTAVYMSSRDTPARPAMRESVGAARAAERREGRESCRCRKHLDAPLVISKRRPV